MEDSLATELLSKASCSEFLLANLRTKVGVEMPLLLPLVIYPFNHFSLF
jgi:hypothetical protein